MNLWFYDKHSFNWYLIPSLSLPKIYHRHEESIWNKITGGCTIQIFKNKIKNRTLLECFCSNLIIMIVNTNIRIEFSIFTFICSS